MPTCDAGAWALRDVQISGFENGLADTNRLPGGIARALNYSATPCMRRRSLNCRQLTAVNSAVKTLVNSAVKTAVNSAVKKKVAQNPDFYRSHGP